MKTALILFLTGLFFYPVNAQHQIGITASGNLSKRWSQTNENYEYFFKPGYGLGVYYYYTLDNPKFGLSIDAYYSYFRFNEKCNCAAAYVYRKRNASLFQFPIELNYVSNKISFSGGLKFVFGYGVGGGVVYSEFYNGTITEPIYDDLWQYSKFDFGLTAGIKFRLSKKIQIGLNAYQSVIDNGRKYDQKAYWTRFDFSVYYSILKKDR